MTRREIPQWVVDFITREGAGNVEYRSGYVRKRDGVIIDSWYPSFGLEEGFWRDAGLGVEQWVSL